MAILLAEVVGWERDYTVSLLGFSCVRSMCGHAVLKGQHLGCTEACNSLTASLTAWELCSNDVAAPPMGASLHHLSIHCIISPSALHHLTVVPCPFQQDRVGRLSCEDGVINGQGAII